MSEINDGGQAFPITDWPGMTLREWYAGQTLVGLISGCKDYDIKPPEYWSSMAYKIADAMIAEGKKGK